MPTGDEALLFDNLLRRTLQVMGVSVMRHEADAMHIRTSASSLLLAAFLVTSGCEHSIDCELPNSPDDASYEAFRIPSNGMAPTFSVNDHVLVDTTEYASRDPQKGELVFFRVARRGGEIHPTDERPDWQTEIFVKRLFALPGDSVAWTNEGPVVNGVSVHSVPTNLDFQVYMGPDLKLQKTQTGDVHHEIIEEPGKPQPQVAPLIVPPGRYFFVGDFRTSSHDSRIWGSVPRDDLIGPVVLRYYQGDEETGSPVCHDLRVAS